MECPKRSTKKETSFILSDEIMLGVCEQRGKYTKGNKAVIGRHVCDGDGQREGMGAQSMAI